MNDHREGIEYEYFYTAGSGLETFVASELLLLGSSTVRLITAGKVYFLSSLSPDALLSVKSAERLFILVHREPQFLLNRTKRDAISRFRAIVEGESARKWQWCLNKWKEFNRILNDGECNEALQFRVSCKCSGKVKHIFPSFFLGKILAGSLLNTHSKWIPELRRPKLEVLVHADGDMLTVGIACCLFNLPLSKRSYLCGIKGQVVLRPTLCAAMLSLAFKNDHHSLNDPMILLDPMCGSGMILAEALACSDISESLILLGSDSDATQINEAVKTIERADKMRDIKVNLISPSRDSKVREVQLFVADARALPLQNDSVHCIVSDLPFGLKHTCKPWPEHLKNVLRRVMNVVSDKDVEALASTSTESNSLSSVDESDGIITERTAQKERKAFDDHQGKTVSREIAADRNDMGPFYHSRGLKRKHSHGECASVYGMDEINEKLQTIEDARNMLPQIILEMDRVLVDGGRVILIISETLKSCLLEAIRLVTFPCKSTECCSREQQCISTSLSTQCTSTCKSHASGSASRSNNRIETHGKEKTDNSKSKRQGWLCTEEYEVKLGVLDAVICVFNT